LDWWCHPLLLQISSLMNIFSVLHHSLSVSSWFTFTPPKSRSCRSGLSFQSSTLSWNNQAVTSESFTIEWQYWVFKVPEHKSDQWHLLNFTTHSRPKCNCCCGKQCALRPEVLYLPLTSDGKTGLSCSKLVTNMALFQSCRYLLQLSFNAKIDITPRLC
jgi:hypothetical protein